MTPSLMPTGPDAQQLLDTSSMSVVIVTVTSERCLDRASVSAVWQQQKDPGVTMCSRLEEQERCVFFSYEVI